MEDAERTQEERLARAIQVKKQGLLNKFLTKTYHMIDICDPLIASWSDGGNSFIIKDVKEFSAVVLPRFFKHSKFPSFVRQLNFYSFRKLRPSPDARLSGTKSVKFAHEYFRQGQPELLHRIQRITKSQDVCSSDVKSLRNDIADVAAQVSSFSARMDQRLRSMKSAVELDYQHRMATISLSSRVLSSVVVQIAAASQTQSPLPHTQSPLPQTFASSPPPRAVVKSAGIEKPVSPTSVSAVSPLMALSMVATMDREKEFNCT